MPVKRLRIFAGPNGSGKSSLIDRVKDLISLGVYVNADEIEKIIREQNCLDFYDYKIETNEEEVKSFFTTTGFSITKTGLPGLSDQMNVIDNVLHFTGTDINSYIAADLAEFIRQKLLSEEISFTFETVLSHPGKLELLRKAKEKGFRVYLYYVATEDPDINVNRVQIRVAQDGHPVDRRTIIERYHRSLELLYDTIKLSDRAYLFDNSYQMGEFFAEITDGEDGEFFVKPDDVPGWFIKYVTEKNT